MKITKKYLQKIIKEETSDAIQQKEVDKLLSAIEDGLVAKGIRLREELKVSNIRRYKGSGTGYTVEIEVAAFGED